MSPGEPQVRTPSGVIQVASLLGVMALALIRGVGPFSEPDYWWHLRVGEHILATHDLVFADPWALLADRPYMATQWLPETVAAIAYGYWGNAAVLWLRAAAIIALALVVYATSRRAAGRLPAALATSVALLGASASLNPRPQLLSFLFFGVVLWAWWGTATDLRPRWWLVPLFWLWACCHPLWGLGVILGVLFTVALVLDPRTRPGRRDVVRLSALNLACVVALILTPVGPKLLLAPFTVANNAAWIADEWKATPVGNPFAITSVAAILLTAVLWARRPPAPPLWAVVLLGLAAFCTLWMWRLVPFGAIAAAPLLALAMQSGLPYSEPHPDRREWRHVAFAGSLALLLAALLALHSGSSAPKYPGEMGRIDTALSRIPGKTVVYSDFGLSGWMLWKHPDLVPVADLRMEIYSPQHLQAYIAAGEVKPGWKAFLVRSDVRYAVVKHGSALSEALTHRLEWRVIAETSGFTLLGAPEGTAE